jgi:hypothetical protein
VSAFSWSHPSSSCCSQQDTSSSAFNGAQFSHNFSN